MDDILFDDYDFILEIENGVIGGNITSYSFDGFNFDFISSIAAVSEICSVFIS